MPHTSQSSLERRTESDMLSEITSMQSVCGMEITMKKYKLGKIKKRFA